MKAIVSVLNQHEELLGVPVYGREEQERTCDASVDSLKVQIENRAHEISQRGGELGGQGLANWLKAAREILSEDSERPQLNV